MTLSVLITVVLLIALGTIAYMFVVGMRKGNTKNKAVLIVSAVVLFLLLVCVPGSIHTIEPGQVAVVKVWGEAKYTRTPGTYFDFWLAKDYVIYDATVQQENITTMCYSSDAQTMDVSLVVQYKIQPQHAIDIANNYGGLELLGNRIEAISVDNAKTILSKKSAMSIIETRSTVSPDIEELIKSSVTHDYYVDIVTVVITNIDFSDAFENTVEEKMIAEQQKLKAEYEKEKAIIEAEKELEVSRLQAQAVVATAEGNADAKLMLAEAEAKAVKVQSVEIARMLGFTIRETATEDGIVYDIDFTGKTAEEIKVISEYLKYATYLETWDGTLPTTLVTDGGASVLVPTA